MSAAAGRDRRELAAIFAGGAAGALGRGALERSIHVTAGQWPWATFTVNMLGALVLGYTLTRLRGPVPLPVYARALVGVGFCGALTTFSTLMAELMAMLRGSHWALAGGYAAASVLGGLAAVALATQVAERVRRAP